MANRHVRNIPPSLVDRLTQIVFSRRMFAMYTLDMIDGTDKGKVPIGRTGGDIDETQCKWEYRGGKLVVIFVKMDASTWGFLFEPVHSVNRDRDLKVRDPCLASADYQDACIEYISTNRHEGVCIELGFRTMKANKPATSVLRACRSCAVAPIRTQILGVTSGDDLFLIGMSGVKVSEPCITLCHGGSYTTAHIHMEKKHDNSAIDGLLYQQYKTTSTMTDGLKPINSYDGIVARSGVYDRPDAPSLDIGKTKAVGAQIAPVMCPSETSFGYYSNAIILRPQSCWLRPLCRCILIWRRIFAISIGRALSGISPDCLEECSSTGTNSV